MDANFKVFDTATSLWKELKAILNSSGVWTAAVTIFGERPDHSFHQIQLDQDGIIRTSPVARAQLESMPAMLAAGATYTGTGTDAINYTRVIGIVISDQDGELYIDQCEDNLWTAGSVYTTQVNLDAATISGQSRYVGPIDQQLGYRYVRIRYKNIGGSTTTVIQLGMYLTTVVR